MIVGEVFDTGEVVGEVVGDGPPLLLLHGGPGLSDYLGGVLTETVGWRAVHYQQRGLRPSTAQGPFSVDQHVADAVGVLDHLALDDVVVLGHSWGGALAVALVAAAPHRVRGLVLVDTLGFVADGGFAEFARRMSAAMPQANRARAVELDARAMAGEGTDADALEGLRLAWPAYFADPAAAPPMPLDMRLSTQCYADTFDSLRAVLADGTLPAAAAAFLGPVEVLHGSRSPMPTSVATTTAAAFPRGVATGVPRSGHFPWLETPGCIAATLDRVRSRLDR